jgi:type I restriction enzyme S subunit
MINDLKPYPAMKDSGVPWLGKVPEHWDVRRMKYLLRERDVRSAAGTEQLLRVSQFTGVTERKRGDSDKEPDTRAESLAGYKLVEPDNLVVNIMLAWNGSMGVSRFFGITSPAYCVYRFSPSVKPWYFHHLLRSPAYKARIKAVSTGIVESRLRLYSDDLYRLDGLLPPVAEQTAIVRFLNHTDRKIRRYIRAKQKLIKLLEEQKQAIIHRAVTRGLDPNVRRKPSGVEWLGDVPEHWDVLSLRRVITRAVDGPHHSPNYVDSGIPFLSARNIKTDRWSLDDAKFISEDDYVEFSKRVRPEPGDVLYTKGGTTGVARVVDLPFKFQVWVHVAVLKTNKRRVVPAYLALVLNSPRCYEQAQLFTRGATNQDLGLGRMKGIWFALPPLTEQHALLGELADSTKYLETAIEKAQQEIALLREYRTRMIADVVTGRLDVREAAAGLPDEALEEEYASDEMDEDLEAGEGEIDLDDDADA